MPSTLSLFGLALMLGSAALAISSTRRINTYRHSRAWPKVPILATGFAEAWSVLQLASGFFFAVGLAITLANLLFATV